MDIGLIIQKPPLRDITCWVFFELSPRKSRANETGYGQGQLIGTRVLFSFFFLFPSERNSPRELSDYDSKSVWMRETRGASCASFSLFLGVFRGWRKNLRCKYFESLLCASIEEETDESLDKSIGIWMKIILKVFLITVEKRPDWLTYSMRSC